MARLKTEIDLYVVERTKERREELRLSQIDLAFKQGVSYGFIGQIESINYPAKYSMNHLDKLAAIFKCSPKDFLPQNPFTKLID